MDVLKQHKLENRDAEFANAFLCGVRFVNWWRSKHVSRRRPVSEFVALSDPTKYTDDLNQLRLFSERIDRQAKLLTPRQVSMLEAAVRHGHAFGNVGVRSMAGGAKLRMADRLGELGLLTPNAPYRITVLGRIVLSRKVK